MTTELWKQILGEVREHYLDGLHQAAAAFKQEYSPAAVEVLLELGRSCAYAYRLYRADMAANVDGKAQMREWNPSDYLNFPPKSFTPHQGLSLALSPLAWNGVDISIDVAASCDGLEQWALRWLDVNDAHAQDERGFQSVIHSVTEPEVADGWTTFSVDFGSAPLVAVEDLLKLLVDMGARAVVMKSDWIQ